MTQSSAPPCCPCTTRPASSSWRAGLHDLGWELVSSGGTAAALADGRPAGHRRGRAHRRARHPRPPRRDAAPEGARRHPRRPRRPGPPGRPRGLRHRADLASSWPTSTRSASEPGIEMIDIGGPAMVRAAAKNHAHVGVVVDPADYAAVLAELRADGALTAPTRRRAGPQGLRPHRGLRRRHRRPGSTPPTRPAPRCCRPRSTSPSSGPRTCATARTRTSRAPATGRSGAAVVVGRCRAARRQGAVLPQPVRRRGGLATRPRARRPARGGRRQARQPVRRGGRRRHHHRLPRRPRRRPGVGLRRHRGPQPAGARGAGRGAGAGVHRGGRGARPSTTTPWRCWPAKKNLRVLAAPPPGRAAARRPHRSTAACSCRSADRVAIDRSAWRVVTKVRPDRGAVGRPRAGLAGRGRGVVQRHRARARTARPSASAPASRTGSTRPASPPRRRPGGPPAVRAPATPSSRSATASTRPPPPAWPRSSSRVARSATTR